MTLNAQRDDREYSKFRDTATGPAVAVWVVDSNGNIVSSFGGGSQYTQDGALTIATTAGPMAMGRASAAAPSDVSADDDAVLPWYLRSGAQAVVVTAGGALIGATANALDVNIKSGASSGAVAQGSTTSGQTGPLIQAAVTTSSPTYTTAQTYPLSLDTTGALRVNVTAGGAGGGAVTVADGADVTLGAKSDAKSAATDSTAITAMQVLKQISASVQAPPSQAVTQSGTWTVQPGNTANTTAWKVDGSAVTQPVSGTVTANAGTNLNTSALALESGGNLAAVKTDVDKLAASIAVTGGTIPADAVNVGVQAVTSENAAQTTAKLSQLVSDAVGKLIVLPYANPENFVSGVTAAMTGTTTTSLLGAPATGLRNYITHIIATNSHATVGTFVIIQDGSGGTTLYEGYAAAVGGGFSITLPTPLRQPTTATALYCACVTTGSNTIVSASGYKGI